jgi:2-haloacid dehalogenase
MMWLKPMATPYSRAFQNKTGLGGFVWKWYVDDYYKKRILITPTRKPALETLKNGTNKPQFMNSNNTKPVIVFDVNETLLDMAPLKITSIAFEEPQASNMVWYGTTLFWWRIVQINTMTSVKSQEFQMTADSLGKTVSAEDMIKALSAIKTLKAYPC